MPGWACLGAWMVEVVVSAGRTSDERRRMFDIVLVRFLLPSNRWKMLPDPVRRIAHTGTRVLRPVRGLVNWLKNYDPLVRTVSERWMLFEARSRQDRAALLRIIFDRLKKDGRFEPSACLETTWERLEQETSRRFAA
jgi:hypothetical protein